MRAARLGRQFVLQAAALLIQLHHRVLPLFGQDRTLTALFEANGQTMAVTHTTPNPFFNSLMKAKDRDGA